MANPEHLNLLKQGVKEWNEWRDSHPNIKPDLSKADLSWVDLRVADLSRANFSRADLRYADLTRANLIRANLSHAHLLSANFDDARIDEANLSSAYLYSANLNLAKLSRANLSSANLQNANLSKAYLAQAVLNKAMFGGTVLAFIDLSRVMGLGDIKHMAPSELSNHTIHLSQGMLPEVFLRGCGLSDWEIESAKLHQPGLSNEEINDILYKIHDLRAHQAIQINPLFISYSHADSLFVDKIEIYLSQYGIRFWRDIHHATAGRLERQVDRAIRLNPTVLLILSSHSTKSDWVEHEVRLARELEKETKRDVLCPIALDDTWKFCDWPERLREQIMEYNILDFSNWHSHSTFDRMFGRLIEGLNLFYKKPDDTSDENSLINRK
jgi:hypothetical protein